MIYPAILVSKSIHCYPELVLDASYYRSPLQILSDSDMLGARLYTRDGLYEIKSIHSEARNTWWNRLLHAKDAAYWDVCIDYQVVEGEPLESVVEAIMATVRWDDDWMTQYFDVDSIELLLNQCRSFEHLLCTVDLLGILSHMYPTPTLLAAGLEEYSVNPDDYWNAEDALLPQIQQGISRSSGCPFSIQELERRIEALRFSSDTPFFLSPECRCRELA